MTKALFLWRVAFLCNLCYLCSIYLRMHPSDNYGSFQSTVLIMGTILGFTLNVISLGVFIFSRSRHRQWDDGIFWLPVVNAVIFVLQLIDLIY